MFGRNTHAEPVLAGVYLLTTTAIIGGLVLAHCSMRCQTLEARRYREYQALWLCD